MQNRDLKHQSPIKTILYTDYHFALLISISFHRYEEERLAVERARLAIEERRLKIEERKLELLEAIAAKFLQQTDQ